MKDIKASHIFKKYRERSGKSMRKFASEAGISLNRLICYENGTSDVSVISVEKAVRIISLLNVDMDDFYRQAFPETQKDVMESVMLWKSSHPRDYNAKSLEKKYRNRISKLLKRGQITEEEYVDISSILMQCFCNVDAAKDEAGNIDDICYSKEILPLSYKIRQTLSKQRCNDIIADRIDQCILSSDYKYGDVNEIIGLSRFPLKRCRSVPDNYRKLQLKTTMKLCYVLEKSFKSLYLDGVNWP